MNILNTTYTNEESVITKTERIVKVAMKRTAYVAFLGIAVASALHLYNNPEDRKATKNGLKSIAAGVEAEINLSVMRLTEHDFKIRTEIAKVSHFAEENTNNAIEKIKEITPTKKDGEKIIKRLGNAGEVLNNGIKKESPEIGAIIKKDVEDSTTKSKEEVKDAIKQVRQYSNDTDQKLKKELTSRF